MFSEIKSLKEPRLLNSMLPALPSGKVKVNNFNEFRTGYVGTAFYESVMNVICDTINTLAFI